MALITIPNVSEGRDPAVISRLGDALSRGGCRLLDVHSDAVHNRTVFTATGTMSAIVDGASLLAQEAASVVDLRIQTGVHPRVGALDVCPVVAHEEPRDNAIAAALAVGAAIAQRAGLPVYLYGDAVDRSLPEIRRGGLAELMRRSESDFPPDFGPRNIDPRTGVVCVAARGPLIAFNVWFDAPVDVAEAIAATVRERSGGLPGVRALGLPMPRGESQVSMNLTRPEAAGVDAAFDAVVRAAAAAGVEPVRTELVGLIPERYLPTPDAQAARLLVEPGRCLELALAR